MKITQWDGKTITEPGWYSGVPIERYHSAGLCSGPAVSSTNLRKVWLKSPKHMYVEWCENPNAEPREATKPMILGAVAHHLMLGEAAFDTKYAAQPEYYPDAKTKEPKPWTYAANYCKDWRARQESKGRTVVPVKDLHAILEMAKSLSLQSLVKEGLANGHVELTGVYIDHATGLWVKVRPDVVPPKDDTFVDLKTAREVTTPALQYALREQGYHQQGALMWEACKALDHEFSSFMLMFVETANPWCARTQPIAQEAMGLAVLMNRSALNDIAESIARDHWAGPGEDEDLSDLHLSKDETARIMARLKLKGLL